MAYREVRMMDIDQVIRRWLAGEKIRAIARLTGSDRNTVRRIVRLAEEVGIRAGTPWPEEGKLQAIRQRMGRPGAVVVTREAEELLQPRTEQIRAWLDKDHLLLTKVHELLGRERSEEHTSELQSRLHLVCRLLLEKKKIRAICFHILFTLLCATHGYIPYSFLFQ